MTTSHGKESQRGSAATELVLATPLVIVLLLFVAFGGRVVMASSDVDSAARDAARAASLARDPNGARAGARAAAAAALDGGNVACAQLDVTVDTRDFHAGGSVAVAITCAVKLSDLALFGMPGSRTLTGHALAPVDVYRGTR